MPTNKELDVLIKKALLQERRDKIQNVLAMADNLRRCPANERFMGEMLAVVAQALYDVGSVLEKMNEDVQMLIEFRKKGRNL